VEFPGIIKRRRFVLKKFFYMAVAVFILSGSADAASAGDPKPFKFSVADNVYTPKTDYVKRLDFGLFATKTRKVSGIQVAFISAILIEKSEGLQYCFISKSGYFDGAKLGFLATSENMRGFQAGFVSVANNFDGFQAGFIVKSKVVKGVQVGLINSSDDVNGVQVGIINCTKTMNGIQIGLLNIIKNSKLPAMIILNAYF
jgi:hypothetical protein